MDFTYTVEVIEKETNEAELRYEVTGLSQAHKLKSGLEINMNKDKYFVRVYRND